MKGRLLLYVTSNRGLKLLTAFALVAYSAFAVNAQGTVVFQNVQGSPLINAPVYLSDGVTKLSGSQFMAELLGGPSPDSLAPIATTPFLTGNEAGYYMGGVQTIAGVEPGTMGWVEVEVWNTASGSAFEQAKASGLPSSWWESSVFSVLPTQFNGVLVPDYLRGLGISPVYLNAAVPEPSTLALFGMGVVLVLRKCLTRRGTE